MGFDFIYLYITYIYDKLVSASSAGALHQALSGPEFPMPCPCRRARAFISPTTLVLVLAGLACGRHRGAKAPAAVPAEAPLVAIVPQGVWTGTLTQSPGRTRKARALVLASGEVVVLTEDQLALHLTLTGGAGQGTAHALGGTAFPDGGRTVQATARVIEVQNRRHFSGTYRCGNQEGRFLFNHYEPGFDRELNMSLLAGVYGGEVHTGGREVTVVLACMHDGTVTGFNEGGDGFKGVVTLGDPAQAAVKVHLGGPFQGGEAEDLDGLAFARVKPDGGVALILALFGAKGALTGDLDKS